MRQRFHSAIAQNLHTTLFAISYFYFLEVYNYSTFTNKSRKETQISPSHKSDMLSPSFPSTILLLLLLFPVRILTTLHKTIHFYCFYCLALLLAYRSDSRCCYRYQRWPAVGTLCPRCPAPPPTCTRPPPIATPPPACRTCR